MGPYVYHYVFGKKKIKSFIEAYVIFAPMNTTSLQLHLVEQATTVHINKDQWRMKCYTG